MVTSFFCQKYCKGSLPATTTLKETGFPTTAARSCGSWMISGAPPKSPDRYTTALEPLPPTTMKRPFPKTTSDATKEGLGKVTPKTGNLQVQFFRFVDERKLNGYEPPGPKLGPPTTRYCCAPNAVPARRTPSPRSKL